MVGVGAWSILAGRGDRLWGVVVDYQEDEMKYCEDCKHFKKGLWNGDLRCYSPKAKFSDGDHCVSRRNAPYASIERQYGYCGFDGKNWEAKP
jgi:hypothetical protein